MKGFIVDATYRLIDGKAYVYLFGRLANGESFLTINNFKPYFYIREKDAAKAQKIAAFDLVHPEQKIASMDGHEVVKAVFTLPKDVPMARQAFESSGIICYEADIRFTMRFLMDHGILATLDIHGDHKQGRYVSRIYEEPVLTPVDYTPQLVTLSLDIETSLDGEQLYALSLATNDKHVTLLMKSASWKHAPKLAQVEIYDDEKALLERFSALLQSWDPDIVTGWNVIDFDFAFLKERFDKHKVPFILGRAEWPSTLRIEKEFLRDSTAEFAGRAVLDGIHLLRSSFIRLDDYKLETAAQEFLGEGKLLKGDDRHREIERLYLEDPGHLVAYNLEDARLVLKILAKAQLVELTVKRSMLTGLTMDRVRASIASFDSVYLRALHAKGLVGPSGQFVESDERITGGFVRESKPGIYDHILVLDFKSMYPSIIRTFNIDPASRVEKRLAENRPGHSTKDVVVAPNGAAFKNDEGILPAIIEKLWRERDAAKRRKDAVASLALKTLMNSFFGVLASPNCRFYSLDTGNAITSYARQFIKLAAERIEGMGYEVIYGDTDSVFVKTNATDVKDARAIGTRIQDAINSFYKESVWKEYHRENFMEIQAEKVYRKFLMPKLRGKEEGAKKRYAGLLVKEHGEELDFTGLEFVRRDWTELAKQFQMELLNRIFHEEEVAGYVKKFVADVKAGKHDDLLVYRKSIRKELAEYEKTTPPHVKAARILEEKEGKIESPVIEYVMTLNGPEPLKYVTAAIDYDHYLEKQVKPLADSVLGFYDTSFDDLVAGSSQKKLFGY